MNWTQLLSFSTVRDSWEGKKHPYWTNPSNHTLKQIEQILKSRYKDNPHMRAIVDHDQGKMHVWPADGPTHEEFMEQTGLLHNHNK